MTQDNKSEALALLPCPFCGKAMQLRYALWASEGDRDAVIHAEPTDCPIEGAFSIDTFDNGVSVAEAWNDRARPSISEAQVEAAARALEAMYHGDDADIAPFHAMARAALSAASLTPAAVPVREQGKLFDVERFLQDDSGLPPFEPSNGE